MKASTIMNVEVSAICNLSCQYCMSPTQANYRPIGLMDTDTYTRVIGCAQKFVKQGTQTELNLFGIGEPLMNANIVPYVKQARDALPLCIPIHINTNGGMLTLELARSLQEAGITQIDVTGHNPLWTARALRILRSLKIRYNVSFDFVLFPNNWAGQVNWFPSEIRYRCPWVARGQLFIAWNGDILQCCFDAKATNILGNIRDIDLCDIECKPFELCKSCHQITEG